MAFANCVQLRALLIASILVISYLMLNNCGSFTISCILSVIFVIFIYHLNKRYYYCGKIQPLNKAVLITGCDTGFGNLLAKRLDSRGFQVFASCLFPDGAGADDLRQTCSSRLQILPLDVTKHESVESAFTFVKENLGSNVLWAVVNNAGIAKGFSVDFSTVQHFKDTLDVNTLGPVRVTKAFLPLLKKSKGRIINVTSRSGRMPTTDLCAYTMSKHAVVAFTECLNLEMIPWSIRVISIEPELFRTPIADGKNTVKRLEDELKEIDEDILTAYGEKYVNRLKKTVLTIAGLSCDDLDIVLDAMESAICEAKPSRVYKPSRNLPTLVFRYIEENMPRDLYEFFYCIAAKFFGYPVLEVKRENLRK